MRLAFESKRVYSQLAASETCTGLRVVSRGHALTSLARPTGGLHALAMQQFRRVTYVRTVQLTRRVKKNSRVSSARHASSRARVVFECEGLSMQSSRACAFE